MTPKQLNLGILLAMLSKIGLIGSGVGLMAGLGAGLLAAGLSVFVCLILIDRAMSQRASAARSSAELD